MDPILAGRERLKKLLAFSPIADQVFSNTSILLLNCNVKVEI
jgi:hypothetical protein